MAISNLNMASGSWLVANCADIPSDEPCEMVIMGPAGQRADHLEVMVAHAVQKHGHTDSSELRQSLAGLVQEVDV